MRGLSLALCLAAAPMAAGAQDAMSGAAFEAYTTGKTLLYSLDGQVYGGEDYLPGRRVRWSFLDGRCLDGRWFESDALICFVYEDNPAPVCWSFHQTPSGLVAFLNGETGETLYETGEAPAPLNCLGPEVGV